MFNEGRAVMDKVENIIKEFEAAIRETRQKFDEAGERIDALELERKRVTEAPAHADYIVAAFKRGLDAANVNFEQGLKDRLRELNTGSNLAVLARSPLSVVRRKGVEISADALQRSTDRDAWSEIDAAAITYFLRDKIEAELPRLVEKLLPQSLSGMQDADRRAKLAEIDAEITELKAERQRLGELIDASTVAAYKRQGE